MVVGNITVSGVNPILAFKCNVPVNIERQTVSGSNFYYRLRAQSDFSVGLQYWVFDVAGQASYDSSLVNCGLQFFDANSVKTFDAAMSSMIVVDEHTIPIPPNNMPNGLSSGTFNDTRTTYVPAGKTYAIVQSTPTFISTTFDTGNYSDSNTYPDEMPTVPDGSGPSPGAQWREQILEFYHSTGRYSNSSTIQVGIDQFEEFKVWNPYSAGESLRITGQSRHLVVDVTNLPAAAMPSPNDLSVTASSSLRSVSVSVSTATATTDTPSVTVTASGGGTYSYQWERVSGDDRLVPVSGTTSATFSTRSSDQPEGTRSAVWRCRVTSNGRVGYSPEITFRHIVDALDTSVSPISTPRLSINTNDNVGWAQTPPIQVTGIDTPITLRVERYNYSGNLSRGWLEIRKSSTQNGSQTYQGRVELLASGQQYLDFQISPGEWFVFSINAETDSGRQTATVDIAVHNQTGNQTSLIYHTATPVTIDADNNYNVSDYTANALNVQPLTINTNDPNGWAQIPSTQITGINRPITLRVERYNYNNNLQNLDRCYMEVHKSPNGVDQWVKVGTIQGLNFNGYQYVDFTITNGEYFVYSIFAQTDSGRREADVQMVVYNLTGNQTLVNINQHIVIDADNNHNTADYRPNTLTFSNVNLSTNDNAITGGTVTQITGINQTVGLRFQEFNYSGNLDDCWVDVFRSSSSSGPWTYIDHIHASDRANRYCDISVNNGDWIMWSVQVAYTNSGRKEASFNIAVYNNSLADGVQISNRRATIVVDADNNYNVANDTYPDAISSFNQVNISTTARTGSTYSASRRITGINQVITLRVERYDFYGDAGLGPCTVNVQRSSDNSSWSTVGSYSPNNGGYQYSDIQVSNGDYIRFQAVANAVFPYRGEGGWRMVVWNMSYSQPQLSESYVNVYVNTTGQLPPI